MADKQSAWVKLTSADDSKEWSSDEALDLTHWTRQVASAVLGVCWGLLGLTGIFAFLFYLAAVSGVLLLVVFNKAKVQEEVVDRWAVIKESFASGMAVFLVLWVFFYNLFHF